MSRRREVERIEEESQDRWWERVEGAREGEGGVIKCVHGGRGYTERWLIYELRTDKVDARRLKFTL